MTIPELIHHVLGAICRQFYGDRIREFKRDERALTKAISRYGYECHQRGWSFNTEFILSDIMKVLIEIKRTGSDIKYLPTYLEGAMTRHIGQRAEELQAKARQTKPKVERVIKDTQVAVVIQPENTQILAAVYRDLKAMQSANRKARAAGKSTVTTVVKPTPKIHQAEQAALL